MNVESSTTARQASLEGLPAGSAICTHEPLSQRHLHMYGYHFTIEKEVPL
jgi:hypothetical protein